MVGGAMVSHGGADEVGHGAAFEAGVLTSVAAVVVAVLLLVTSRVVAGPVVAAAATTLVERRRLGRRRRWRIGCKKPHETGVQKPKAGREAKE